MNIDVGDVLEYIDEGGEIGEAPGFFPRGGKRNFLQIKRNRTPMKNLMTLTLAQKVDLRDWYRNWYRNWY